MRSLEAIRADWDVVASGMPGADGLADLAEERLCTDIPDLVEALEAQDAEIERWKTADSEAVKALRIEIANLRETLSSAWWQFAYVNGNGKRWCGGLSALEDIADALGLDV